MRRARRLLIPVVAVLGLVTLGGCRMGPDPEVAAYVGDTEVRSDYVDRIVADFADNMGEEQRQRLNEADLRNQVLHFLILNEVAADYAEAENITVPPADPEGIAQAQGLPAGIELTEVLAEYSALLGALANAAKPVAPTEADQREAYDHATVDGQPVAGEQKFDDVRQFFDEEALGRSLGLRKILVEALADADVTVNPRFDPTYRLPLQIQQASSWLGVELASGTPVRDARAAASDRG